MINLFRSGLCALLLLSGCGWDNAPTRANDFVELTSITISADTSTIAKDTSIKLTATGNYSGVFTRDITDQVVWSSASTAVAEFRYATAPNKNRVTAVAPGTVVVTATIGSVSGTYPLTVSSAVIKTLTVTPAAPSLAMGLTTQFTAIGDFLDGAVTTSQNLTFDAAWAAAPGTFATISNDPASKGRATATAIGTETITAAFGSATSAPAALVVTAATLQSIRVTPADTSILSLSSRTFTATGSYSDGTTKEITSVANWISSKTDTATITTGGATTAIAPGTTVITATSGTVSGSTGLTVTGGNLNSITVSPSTPTLVKETRTRIKATGTFSDGSIRDITGAVTWTTTNNSLATVTAPGGNLAWLNAVDLTSGTTITATGVSATTKTGTTTLIVTSPTFLSLSISSSTLALTAGTGSQLTATATYSANPLSTDLTYSSNCNWTSDNPSVAAVGTDGLTKGRVTTVAPGTAIITATYGSALVTSTVAVTSRTITSLTLSGFAAVITGNQTSFTATAVYSDGTSVNVTENVTWSLDSPNVAVLSDSTNQPGQLVAVGSGSATLTATFGGLIKTATINVP